jgi:SAM-dependent methyltransferase
MKHTAVKRIVKRGVLVPFALLPHRVVRVGLRLWFKRVATGKPRLAVRTLLKIDGDLSAALDEAATRYDNGAHVKHRLTRYHDFFVARIRRGERVLDVGCGIGSVAHDIAVRAGAKVIGIDTSDHNLAFARQRFPHPDLVFMEADALHFVPSEPVDVVVLSNVLEHIEQRVAFLRTLVEQVRPARLLVRVPLFERDWRVPLRQELGMSYFSDSTHCTEYTAESFAEEMMRAGLAITHTETRWGEIWAEVRPCAPAEQARDGAG